MATVTKRTMWTAIASAGGACVAVGAIAVASATAASDPAEPTPVAPATSASAVPSTPAAPAVPSTPAVPLALPAIPATLDGLCPGALPQLKLGNGNHTREQSASSAAKAAARVSPGGDASRMSLAPLGSDRNAPVWVATATESFIVQRDEFGGWYAVPAKFEKCGAPLG